MSFVERKATFKGVQVNNADSFQGNFIWDYQIIQDTPDKFANKTFMWFQTFCALINMVVNKVVLSKHIMKYLLQYSSDLTYKMFNEGRMGGSVG